MSRNVYWKQSVKKGATIKYCAHIYDQSEDMSKISCEIHGSPSTNKSLLKCLFLLHRKNTRMKKIENYDSVLQLAQKGMMASNFPFNS